MSYKNPYAQEYEMQHQQQAYGGSGQNDNDFVGFMNGINNINTGLSHYQQLINNIDVLQRRLLSEVNEEREQQARSELDAVTAEATNLQYQLKDLIKQSQQQAIGDSAKEAQAENSRQRFLKAIQDYRIVEVNYKEQNKEQAKRQYRIVQPEATDDEVEAAISDVGGQQIFSQALLNANRRGEAKTALAEVQQRHQELLKLEKTMAELTQLFNDMEQLVIEQQENIEVIDKQVENAQQDVEQGVGHTNKAVKSARRARKNKIRCIIILALVLAIVVVVIVVPVVVKT
ncbi:Sso2/Sso1 [Kluyveromyces lactis]|nr:Sso2/Sso1 [Kluyveromyces lactis]